MPLSPESAKRVKEALRPKPDYYGYLGVPGGGGAVYRGTPAADGYIYDVASHPGYVYARVQIGVEFEVCEVIQGSVARNASQKIGFIRQGPTLVAVQASAVGAVALLGSGAPGAGIPAHTHVSADITDLDAHTVPYTPADTSKWTGSTDPGQTDDALDQLASRVTAVEGSSTSLPNFGGATAVTLASGVASAGTNRHLVLESESGTSDDLTEITGLNVGDEIIIYADGDDTITVKHNDAGATDKILLYNTADIALNGDKTLKLVKIAIGKVVQYVDEKGSGGGAALTPKRSSSTSDLTTTSTTLTPIDSTNIGFTQHGSYTLAIGDMVECVLTAQFYMASGNQYISGDVEVDQPTSANVYISASSSSSGASWLDNFDTFRRARSYVMTFIATEAGVHAFRPVWKVGSGTGHVDGSNTPTYFTTKFLGQ